MKLLLDIGNTRVKWACLGDDGLYGFASQRHERRVELPELFGEAEACTTVWLASVADEAYTSQLEDALQHSSGAQVHRLVSSAECGGVRNGYAEPAQLGVDRWAAMVGARQRYHTALCVVDCGSAMTIDVLDEQGRHLGGYIVPGLQMQQSLLREGTAGVRADGETEQSGRWGVDTRSCLKRGAEHSQAALIERASRLLARELEQRVTTVITGGDAAVILPLLGLDVRYEEHLVLQGMARMVEEQEG